MNTKPSESTGLQLQRNSILQRHNIVNETITKLPPTTDENNNNLIMENYKSKNNENAVLEKEIINLNKVIASKNKAIDALKK